MEFIHSLLRPQRRCFETLHLRALRCAHVRQEIDAGDFLNLRDGGDVAGHVGNPRVAIMLVVVVREQDGDAFVFAQFVFVENDFVEVRGDGDAVVRGNARRVAVGVAFAIAIAVEHGARDDEEVAAFVAPHAHEGFEPFPGVFVKHLMLRRHVGVEVGVNHHGFGAGEVGIGREVALIVIGFVVVVIGASGRGVRRKARVGRKQSSRSRGVVTFFCARR